MAQFSDGESGASVRTKINATIATVDGIGTGNALLMTAAEQTALGTAVQPAAAMLVVTHDATAGTARPAAGAVYWIGSVAPTNAVDGDIWHDTSV